MTTLLGKAEGQYLMIYFVSLVTGMRISEAVAIEIDKHIEPDCSIIYVRQQREKDVGRVKPNLKTEAGLRDVDIHPDAAEILRNFIGGRKRGFLFQTANGTMFDPGNIDRDSLSPILKEMGRDEAGTRFNVFRRLREAVLQRSEARQILIDYWMGHCEPKHGRPLRKATWWKMLNTGRSKLRKLAWDSSFLRRCLGYVGYEFLKTAQQPNE